MVCGLTIVRAVSFTLVVGGVAAGSGCSKVAEAFGGSFKQSYQESFTQSCTHEAVKEGGQREVVGPVCACFAKHLVEHNDTGALTKASIKPDGPEFQKMLMAASNSCTSPQP